MRNSQTKNETTPKDIAPLDLPIQWAGAPTPVPSVEEKDVALPTAPRSNGQKIHKTTSPAKLDFLIGGFCGLLFFFCISSGHVQETTKIRRKNDFEMDVLRKGTGN